MNYVFLFTCIFLFYIWFRTVHTISVISYVHMKPPWTVHTKFTWTDNKVETNLNFIPDGCTWECRSNDIVLKNHPPRRQSSQNLLVFCVPAASERPCKTFFFFFISCWISGNLRGACTVVPVMNWGLQGKLLWKCESVERVFGNHWGMVSVPQDAVQDSALHI